MKIRRLLFPLILVFLCGTTGRAQVTDDAVVYEQIQKHTVRLFESTEGNPFQYSAVCTAVLIDKQQTFSLLLTAGHCVDDEDGTYLVFSGKPYPVIRIYRSHYTDLAMIFVEGSITDKEPAVFSERYLIPGDRLYNFAYPGPVTFRKTGEFLDEDWYAGSASFVVIPGCSGSGIFNDKGELEGIVISYDKNRPVSYYVTVNEFNRFLHQLDVDGITTTVTAG